MRLCRVVDRQSSSTTKKQQSSFTVSPEPKQQAYAVFMQCPNYRDEEMTTRDILFMALE